MVLRSMAKAAYAPEAIGHFGLALKDYAHFTSPIRRYPDLAIHRILSNYCENPNAEAMHEKYDAFVIEASMRSSDTEVRAITIERNADDCYKAEYMQQHLGEIFDGIIAGVTDFGFYVALPNTVEGLVHVSTLPESDWINDDSIAFKEEQGSACYRLTVTAERHSNFEDKDKKNKYVRCERSYGTYARSFDISGIDAKAIKAAYSDGVLRVTLPKQKEVPASSRRLEIE